MTALAVTGAAISLATYLGYRYPADYRHLPMSDVLPSAGWAASSVAVFLAALLLSRRRRRGSWHYSNAVSSV